MLVKAPGKTTLGVYFSRMFKFVTFVINNKKDLIILNQVIYLCIYLKEFIFVNVKSF